MKKYYCVLSIVYNDGRAEAAIVDTATAAQKPNNICAGADRVIVRLDWFESYEEAEKAVRETVAA